MINIFTPTIIFVIYYCCGRLTMKKILFILALILLTPTQSFALEEVNLEFDNDFQKLSINDNRQEILEPTQVVMPSEVFETSSPTCAVRTVCRTSNQTF